MTEDLLGAPPRVVAPGHPCAVAPGFESAFLPSRETQHLPRPVSREIAGVPARLRPPRPPPARGGR